MNVKMNTFYLSHTSCTLYHLFWYFVFFNRYSHVVRFERIYSHLVVWCPMQTIRRHVLEDSRIRTHSGKNVKSYNIT